MTSADHSPDLGSSLYPIVVVQDRYSGAYSGGEWLAVARADAAYMDKSRVGWVIENGPGGGDGDAGTFWDDPPKWIAAAETADQAIVALRQRSGAAD